MCEDERIDSIGHELKAINHLMQRQMLKSAADHGVDKVTLMHGWIIGYLEQNAGGDVYQKDIETQFAISRSTVTNIVKCMEKKGYIERISVDSDARLKKLVLTDTGREVGAKIHDVIVSNEERMGSLLTPQEREQLIAIIHKLRDGLTQLSPKGECV